MISFSFATITVKEKFVYTTPGRVGQVVTIKQITDSVFRGQMEATHLPERLTFGTVNSPEATRAGKRSCR